MNGVTTTRALGSIARVPRAKAQGGLSYAARATQAYSAAQLEQIAHAIESEELRGTAARWWDDVVVGESVRPMLKGPLNITDMICWYSAPSVPAGGGISKYL